MDPTWYYTRDAKQIGPVTMDELKKAAAEGQLRRDDLVWGPGQPDWAAAETIPGLTFGSPTAPPPAAASRGTEPRPRRDREPEPARGDDRGKRTSRPARRDEPEVDSGPAPWARDDRRGGRERDREPERDRGRSRRDEDDGLSLDDDHPRGPSPFTGVMANVGLFCKRAFAPNLAKMQPSAAETAELEKAGVADETAQRYAVWRRGTLWVTVVVGGAAALFALIGAIDDATDDKKGLFEVKLNALGQILTFIQPLLLFAIPVCRALGALAYTRPAKSARLVLIGALIVVLGPILLALIPRPWLLDSKQFENVTVKEKSMAESGYGMIVGVIHYITLVPTVLALLTAVARGSVRLKSLLPASVIPGWALVTSVPLCALLTVTAALLTYHVMGNLLFVFGLLLVVGAPLLYLSQVGVLTRPATSRADMAALDRVQWFALLATIAGFALLLIFLFTAEFFGVTILGFDKEKSIIRPWNADLHRWWIEYVARALFLTVLFADLVLQVTLSVWREERAFAGTDQAQGFDQTLSVLNEVVNPPRPVAAPADLHDLDDEPAWRKPRRKEKEKEKPSLADLDMLSLADDPDRMDDFGPPGRGGPRK